MIQLFPENSAVSWNVITQHQLSHRNQRYQWGTGSRTKTWYILFTKTTQFFCTQSIIGDNASIIYLDNKRAKQIVWIRVGTGRRELGGGNENKDGWSAGGIRGRGKEGSIEGRLFGACKCLKRLETVEQERDLHFSLLVFAEDWLWQTGRTFMTKCG